MAAKTGSGLRRIFRWQQQYQPDGIDGLLKCEHGCGCKPIPGVKEQQL